MHVQLSTLVGLSFALAAGSLAAQDAPPAVSFGAEAYGEACGASIYGAALSHEVVELGLRGAAPGAHGVLLLGTRSADQALPNSACRLLLQPDLAVPFTVGSDGSGAVTMPTPDADSELLHAQVVHFEGDGLRASGGLTLHSGSDMRYEGKLLASLNVDDARFLFVEPEPGEVYVMSAGSGTPPAGLEGEIDAVSVYEHLAHRPAPAALRAAAGLSEALRSRSFGEPEADVAPNNPQPGPMAATNCYSSSWFQTNHCWVANWGYCYLNNYSNPWVSRNCWGMWGYTTCNTGTYEFEYRRKRYGSWRTESNVRIYSCQWARISAGYSWRARKMHVKFGDGDAKHMSVRG